MATIVGNIKIPQVDRKSAEFPLICAIVCVSVWSFALFTKGLIGLLIVFLMGVTLIAGAIMHLRKHYKVKN